MQDPGERHPLRGSARGPLPEGARAPSQGRNGARPGINPLKLAILYIGIGAVWIFTSDRLIRLVAEADSDLYLMLQTYKGWLFVLVSGVLFYFLGNRLVQAVQESRYKISFQDPLTNLPNRAMLRIIVQEKIELFLNEPADTMSLILIKLKRLDKVNESFGPLAGDEVLLTATDRLLDSLKPTHTVARVGGDTFAVLSTEGPVPEHALALVRTINRRITQPIAVQNDFVQLQIHCGIVCPMGRYTSAEHLLRDAENALHHARERNELLHIFQAEYHSRAVERFRLEAGFRNSLKEHQFFGKYQPIYALNDETIVGMECLARWRRNGSAIGPDSFLAIAEDTLLIRDLGRELFEGVCKEYRAIQQILGLDSFFISFNLSANQITDPELLAYLMNALERHGLPPASIKLEITETAAMQNILETSHIFDGLKNVGFGLAIDDFGTGYSSLEYLERFPFETLKIDKGFIDGMERSASKKRIVQSIVALARNLDLSVVAEGVENEEQRGELLQFEELWAQGFLFCRPLTLEGLREWSEQRTGLPKPWSPA
jgi:diguanylate cyclase (GGDEF)-like protein